MDSLKHPLTDAQPKLLKLFNRTADGADWLEIRRMITRCFVDKATRGTDKLWDEQGWKDQPMTD